MTDRATRRALFGGMAAGLIGFVSPKSASARSNPIPYDPVGGVNGGGVFWEPNGDAYFRNYGGGTNKDPNVDIGAGSTEHPGTLSLNWDVGKKVIIYDGKKNKLAEFSSKGIFFYKKPKFRVSRRPKAYINRP